MSSSQKGFTIVEVMVSVGIFIFMTGLLVAKYGNFNNSVLMTNLAYDVALTLRTAQTYGLSVQGQQTSSASPSGSGSSMVAVPIFSYPYGVAFCNLTDCGNGLNNTTIIIFADTNSTAATRGSFDATDIVVQTYAVKRGVKILGFCLDAGGTTCNPTTGQTRLDISFMRPNPDSIICASSEVDGSGIPCASNPRTTYAKILLEAPDGNRRGIVVNRSGQISVVN